MLEGHRSLVVNTPTTGPALVAIHYWSGSEGLDQSKEPTACFVFASVGRISEGYGLDGPGVCLGDGHTEAYLKDMGMAGLASA